MVLLQVACNEPEIIEKYDPFKNKEDYLIEDILERSFQENILERQESAFSIDFFELQSFWNKKNIN